MPRKLTFVFHPRNNKEALKFAKKEIHNAEQLHYDLKKLIRKGEKIQRIRRTF